MYPFADFTRNGLTIPSEVSSGPRGPGLGGAVQGGPQLGAGQQLVRHARTLKGNWLLQRGHILQLGQQGDEGAGIVQQLSNVSAPRQLCTFR